jgi:rhodanese-related sulfurtransferase
MRLSGVGFGVLMLACTLAYAHVDMTPTEVKAMVDAGECDVVIDVREEWEFCSEEFAPAGHVTGSINMPWDSGYFQAHYGELPTNQVLVIVCQTGYRSNKAANLLDYMGYPSVSDMLGGMDYWEWDTETCDSAVEPGTWSAIKALYR